MMHVIRATLFAQDSEDRISPVEIASVSYKDTYVKITYGQPSKKGRIIFGALVPYNEVWNTGANEATEITLTSEVSIMDKKVSAGTYSLFTIPNPNEWTIILNKDVGLWGSYNYNSRQDYQRWNVPVKKMDNKSFERLTIQFDEKNNSADLNICWDDICVTLPILFNEPKK
jgi:hypothetical protein